MPSPQMPVAEVSVVEVSQTVVPIAGSFVAQAYSSHQVEIISRVPGFLEEIAYSEGKMVQEGQIMFQIDAKPFQSQVEASQSEADIREAQLWVAQANFNRVKPLAEQDAASLSDLDNAIGSLKTAQAALAEAKARLQKAEPDLGYTTIRSPIKGITGQSLFREGAYLTAPGSSALSYVARLDPILPVAFLGGMTVTLYKKFAITIALSMIISGIVALTLSPAMAARILKPGHG